jgi:hypothetical protein
MKKLSFLSVASSMLLIGLLGSCVSLQDRSMASQEKTESEIIGSVTAEWTSFQFFHVTSKEKLKNRAYAELKKAAQEKYTGNIDIKNITITGSFSAAELLNLLAIPAGVGIGAGLGNAVGRNEYLVGYGVGIPVGLLVAVAAGNTQKITVRGDVVEYSVKPGQNRSSQRRIEGAADSAASTLIDKLQRNATIAILSVYSDDRNNSEFVISELEYKFVESGKFKIVDRRRLDQIRNEQNFQMSGEVSDNSAVSIGNMLGATIVITGDISGAGSSQRLVLKALDVKTAQIITMAREQF